MVAESHPRNPNDCQPPSLQFPTMTVAENLIKKKFKIKVGARGVRVESEKESDVLMNDECDNKKSTMMIKVKLPLQGHTNKRRPDSAPDVQIEKRRKMNQSIKHQCGSILKELMTHKSGWAFNQPVDPIAYGIPDYFSIITKPMDLGTIKSKMQNNVYISAEEFAADVRLTFSNCMLYNPPHNEFHGMAKDLNTIFNQRWKFFGEKFTRESNNVEPQSISNVAQGIWRTCRKISPSNERTMSMEQKHNLRKELKEMLGGKMTEKLQSVLKKFNLSNLKERIDVDINSIDDKSLWEFKGMLKSSLCLSSAKVEPAKTTKSGGRPLARNVFDKGMDSVSRISSNPANAKPPMGLVDSRCDSCGCLTCRCNHPISKTHASSSDLSSGRSLQQDLCGDSITACDAKKSTQSCTNLSDSTGEIIEDNVCQSPGFAVCNTNAVLDEGWTPLVDVQLSPKKALRALMLKSRFADTISKANNSALLNQGDKVDRVKLQQEKVKLEKQQREEKARIEAHIIATEAALRLRAEAELKMLRQQEREAARIALQQMEKTVEIDENLKILKDVEMLSRSSMPEATLERFGLYIKEDFLEDDEEEAILNVDGEEGEIIG